MRKLQIVFAVILLHQQCLTHPVEESVVSVYTTHPTTMGTNPPLDVYHQIASNLAERIASPIYRFLGINSTTTTKPESTTKAWNNIELQNEDINKPEIKPVDNNISPSRDVEELSVEALTKSDKKPEKITLYSSYLPTVAKTSEANDVAEAKNDTWNELDDDWDLDDTEEPQKREQSLIYFLELIGSFFQLLWGGVSAFFNGSASSNSGSS